MRCMYNLRPRVANLTWEPCSSLLERERSINGVGGRGLRQSSFPQWYAVACYCSVLEETQYSRLLLRRASSIWSPRVFKQSADFGHKHYTRALCASLLVPPLVFDSHLNQTRVLPLEQPHMRVYLRMMPEETFPNTVTLGRILSGFRNISESSGSWAFLKTSKQHHRANVW